MSGKRQSFGSAAWALYRDGFKNMTWGRPLLWLILLKVFILFAVLRLFFFTPAMSGMSDAEKSDAVGARLTAPVPVSAEPTENQSLKQ